MRKDSATAAIASSLSQTSRVAPLIEAEFGVRVHPRGLEKALERIQKKPLEPEP